MKKNLFDVEKKWDSLSETYFLIVDEKKFPFNLLSKYRNLEVLEAGSGDGEIAIFMAKNLNNVVGIEISDKFLNISNNKISNLGLSNVKFIKGDVRKMPFKNETFDFIFSGGVVEHLDNTFDAIKEHIRVLKKGGLLLIGVPCKEGLHYPLKKIMQLFGIWTIGFEKSFTKALFQKNLEDMGLVIEEKIFIPIEPTLNQSKLRFYITKIISIFDKFFSGTHMMYFLCKKA